MSIVSNNIKYLRKLSGLTQEQFANKIAIKRSLLGAYEEARANPNLTNLENMASAFGISVDNLIKSDLRQSVEKQELSLPFTRSTQMTVSHSGIMSAPRKPVATEPNTQDNPVAVLKTESTVEIPGRSAPAAAYSQEAKIPYPVSNGVQKSNPVSSDPQIPVFNNSYSADQGVLPAVKTFPTIQLVAAKQQPEYILHHRNPSFVSSLPPFQLPNLPWDYYRAFEIGNDFAYPGALLVGSFTRNWYDIRPDVNYVFVLKNAGILYRKAINEVQVNGSFRLISDLDAIQQMHVQLSDILEVWEVKAFVSVKMPAVLPSIEKVEQLVDELKRELQKK